jgi:hypothetical protein
MAPSDQDLNRLTFGLLLAAYLCISFPAGLFAASNPDEEHVREVIAGLKRAWNVHDMHAFTEQFTGDASFVNVNGSWLRSAAQIEESHKVVLATIFKTSKAVIAGLRHDIGAAQTK